MISKEAFVEGHAFGAISVNSSVLEVILESMTFNLIPGAYQLTIVDLDGKRIMSKLIQGKHTEDLSFLPKGIFIAQVYNLVS